MPAKVTRRSVLQAGLIGGGLLALGGVGLGLQSTVMRTPARPLRELTEREFSILLAIAERICPGSPDAPSPAQLGVVEDIDETISRMDEGTANEFKQLLALIENAAFGLVFDQTMRPFTACTPATQIRVLKGWQLSTIALRRSGYRAVSGLCLAAYWANPKTWHLAGYPGPPAFGLPAPEPIVHPTIPGEKP